MVLLGFFSYHLMRQRDSNPRHDPGLSEGRSLYRLSYSPAAGNVFLLNMLTTIFFAQDEEDEEDDVSGNVDGGGGKSGAGEHPD